MGDLIARIINWLKSLFSGSGDSDWREKPEDAPGYVMPRELIAVVLEECDGHAMEYSDTKRQLPCTFSIFLSEEDFDFFYRSNRDEVEKAIVDALNKLVQQTGDIMKTPSCTILIDPELSLGEYRVETSFEAVKVNPPTPVPDPVPFVDPEPIIEPEPTPEPAPTPIPTPDPGPTPSLHTSLPVPLLRVADGSTYEVHDQDVVGILRNRERELPDIILKQTSDLTYCSQRHGRFLVMDTGDVAYENLSGNGSILLRGDESYNIGAGDDPIILEDGDQLVLGVGGPAFTFELA